MRWFIGLIMPALLWGTAAAAEKIRIKVPQENLRTAPNGKIQARVAQGTTLEVVGQRGQWVQVRLHGWVWRPLPEAEKAQVSSPAPVQPKPPVELAGSSLEWRPQDFHRQQGQHRAHLLAKLEFVNHSAHALGAVHYRLVLVDAAGQVLLEKTYDRDLELPPHQEKTRAVTHQWVERSGPSGEEYRRLRAAAEQGPLNLQVELTSAYFLETGLLPLE